MARGRDADWSYQTGALASLLSRCFCRWPAVAFNSVANSLRRWIASSVCSDSVHGEWTEGFRSVAKRTIIANLAASKLRGKYPLAETFTRIGVHQHFHCIRKIKKFKKKIKNWKFGITPPSKFGTDYFISSSASKWSSFEFLLQWLVRQLLLSFYFETVIIFRERNL